MPHRLGYVLITTKHIVGVDKYYYRGFETEHKTTNL